MLQRLPAAPLGAVLPYSVSDESHLETYRPAFTFGRSELYLDDCLQFLGNAAACSIHAVVTDPPYGLVEYSAKEQAKLRNGQGGIWRLPPAFDGRQRLPVPRFT